ncbi:MAG: heme-dependent peroxidase [Gemmatimonadota bacterium]|nr:heme-dependent peroxidase [Gemmatimonadota bacterium]
METTSAYPAETVEGWYALHQMLGVDRAALRAMGHDRLASAVRAAAATLDAMATPTEGGWSALVSLVGSRADVMLVHLRPTLDALAAVQARLGCLTLFDALERVYSFLSVTEVGMYHVAARAARDAKERGGSVGDDAFREQLATRIEKERSAEHVQRRLFPTPPAEMPYVSFYPMSKRRAVGQNWYTLAVEERSRMMVAHGATGRRYAGRIMQIVTGAIGLDAWEWGVTLFARDPLDFKKIVTEMRFDEASANYAEFGEFYVGKRTAPADWLATLGGGTG